MDYQCINNECELVLDVKNSKNSYICPSCGTSMFDLELLDKVKEKNQQLYKGFDIFKNRIDQDKLKELLEEEQKIIRKANKKGLKRVKKYILAFLAMLKDPKANMGHKIIAAAALLYVVSPLDIIPDPFPVIGLADDTLMVLIAVGILSDALLDYMKDPENLHIYDPLFYSVQPESTKIPYRYSEDQGIRVLYLYPDELKQYGLNIIDDNYAKAPELYLGHPYFYKTLIPYKNYEQMLIESVIQEEVSLLTALGAKRIKYTLHSFKQKSKKASVSYDFDKIIKGELAAESKGLKYSKRTKSFEFEDNRQFNLNQINKLVWYFTFESQFDRLIEKRLVNGLKSFEFDFVNSREDYINLDIRVSLEENDTIGGKLQDSQIVYQKLEFAGQFNPLPEDFRNKTAEDFEEIKKILETRKRDLQNKYRQK